MLNKAFKRKIVATLGKQYSGKIITRLNELEILNIHGEAYRPESIQKIVNCKVSNEPVEAVIIDLVQLMQRNNKKKVEKITKIIKSR